MSGKLVRKDDFDKLVGVVSELAKAVNDLKEAKQEIKGTADMSKVKDSSPQIPAVSPNIEIEENKSDKMPIPPTWRKLVDESLGMDFGIDVVYPQTGTGFLFKIIVPSEKSNMSKDYKEFYRVDIRTKALAPSEGIDGIRKFCEAVKKNLERKQTV